MEIHPYESPMKEAVVSLSLRAWEPVFDSLKTTLNAAVYQAFYPDWQVEQQCAVESACDGEGTHVWVAEIEGSIAGFVAVQCHEEDSMGEIHMIAVDPDFQRQGAATALARHALAWMRDSGLSIAMVETGGDPGHAPARRTYENLGFDLFPVSRYFKKL